MQWFKHYTEDDADLFDAIDTQGAMAYMVWYRTLELFGKRFNGTDETGHVEVSEGFLKRHMLVADMEDITKLYDHMVSRGRMSYSTEDGRVKIKITNFMDLASNWVKRRAGFPLTQPGPAEGPAEGPREGPAEGPTAQKGKELNERNERKKKGQSRKQLDLDDEYDSFMDTNEVKELAEEVVVYLNSKTGAKFRYNTKSILRLINGRYKEGATLEDFKKCIDNMVSKWKDDPKMSMYLRPSTLFQGGKFWGYVTAKGGSTQGQGGYHGSGVAI